MDDEHPVFRLFIPGSDVNRNWSQLNVDWNETVRIYQLGLRKCFELLHLTTVQGTSLSAQIGSWLKRPVGLELKTDYYEAQPQGDNPTKSKVFRNNLALEKDIIVPLAQFLSIPPNSPRYLALMDRILMLKIRFHELVQGHETRTTTPSGSPAAEEDQSVMQTASPNNSVELTGNLQSKPSHPSAQSLFANPHLDHPQPRAIPPFGTYQRVCPGPITSRNSRNAQSVELRGQFFGREVTNSNTTPRISVNHAAPSQSYQPAYSQPQTWPAPSVGVGGLQSAYTATNLARESYNLQQSHANMARVRNRLPSLPYQTYNPSTPLQTQDNTSKYFLVRARVENNGEIYVRLLEDLAVESSSEPHTAHKLDVQKLWDWLEQISKSTKDQFEVHIVHYHRYMDGIILNGLNNPGTLFLFAAIWGDPTCGGSVGLYLRFKVPSVVDSTRVLALPRNGNHEYVQLVFEFT